MSRWTCPREDRFQERTGRELEKKQSRLIRSAADYLDQAMNSPRAPKLSEGETAELLRTLEAFTHALEAAEPDPDPDFYRDSYFEWEEHPYWRWVDRFDNPPPGVHYPVARPPHPKNPPPRWTLTLRTPPRKKPPSVALDAWRKARATPPPKPIPKTAAPPPKAAPTPPVGPRAADAEDKRLQPRPPRRRSDDFVEPLHPVLWWERHFQGQLNDAAHRNFLRLFDQIEAELPEPEEIPVIRRRQHQSPSHWLREIEREDEYEHR